MRTIIASALLLICATICFAQTPTSPATASKQAPSADEIVEKSIAATGGREAAQKLTSLVMKGTMDIAAFGASASTETYQKAPDKYFNTASVAGFGDIANGFDGKTGWRSDPQGGLTDVTGEQLASLKTESQFQGDLRFKELYPKAEVTGTEKVGGRDCWVMKVTSSEGAKSTRYYDAETFLLTKATQAADTPQGPGEITAMFSDYKDIGNGVKVPYKVTLNVPGVGDLIITYSDIKYNVPIDDSKFAKPKS